KFGGKMEMPNIELLKMQKSTQFKTRGYWQPRERVLALSPRLFYSDVQVAAEVILHEMAHQATHEISHDFDWSQKGHGPTWRSWMVKIGLNPNRFDSRGNYTYY